MIFQMLKKLCARWLGKFLVPQVRGSWYQKCKYHGADKITQFDAFLRAQSVSTAILYDYFLNLHITRHEIQTVKGDFLDAVLIRTNNLSNPEGLLTIFFNGGQGEYYEARFKDMAMQSKATNSDILGFNYRGVNESEGSIENLQDMVDDAINVIQFAIKILHYDAKNIVLQGNSLGAVVQAMANEYLLRRMRISLRQINSNSFASLTDVIIKLYRLPRFTWPIIRSFLLYTGWEISAVSDFFTTGPHRIILKRIGDRTILPGAAAYDRIDIAQDCADCPEGYREVNRLLYDNCTLSVIDKPSNASDPHNLALHKFRPVHPQKFASVYDLINFYLTNSRHYYE
jgi:pimeloyl-ACP methyl ester carboxylesterase